MFKQLGVIWVVGLAVVFLTLLLGAGLVAVRVFSHWLTTAFPLVLVSPLLAELMQLPRAQLPVLVASLALTAPARADDRAKPPHRQQDHRADQREQDDRDDDHLEQADEDVAEELGVIDERLGGCGIAVAQRDTNDDAANQRDHDA